MRRAALSKSRAVTAVLVAGFVAALCAGPGTLIVPAATRLAEPIVCPEGSRIRHQRVRHSYHRPGESTLEVRCVDERGQSDGSAFGKTVLTLFGIYFGAVFLFLLLRGIGRSGP